ncbi:MAG: DUF2079 domain-containing protein, partial [Cyanobacteria bacterium CAN_BIN43]|nr:DUF2079 domain-containing protein [Cyanobacteria bacterium CAN_BIN43]
MMMVSGLILFLCSSFRHFAYQSTAWDLGIFDQAVYLISQGKPPVSSLMGFHILGDHAAVVFFMFAGGYYLYKQVDWVVGVQG